MCLLKNKIAIKMSETVALVEFFGKQFNIPQYQRGYRWEEQEVRELLDDLWEFQKNSDKGEFYCLQPIVVQESKTNGNGFDVLDGQQRLTTLFIILSYLEDRIKEEGYSDNIYKLDYEIRKNCVEFLSKKKFTSINEENIDFFHISKAYSVVDAWFKDDKHRGAKSKLVPILMDKSDASNKNVRFIWYAVSPEINPIEVFIRLNVGKIPLTDAELIKALLLQSDKYPKEHLEIINKKLFEIGSEWDKIEYALQEEELWYFLNNNENSKPTHIEFIFDMIAEKANHKHNFFEKKPSKYATFLILSKYLNYLINEDERKDILKAVNKVWEEVTEYFEYFKEWYDNRELYHLIGYLIVYKNVTRVDIDTLISLSKENTKSAFLKHLKQEVAKIVTISKDKALLNLSYENDKEKIHQILLWHNVITTSKSDKEKARFPFNLYKQTKKKEKWSLEHIHAQNSEELKKLEDQKNWLKDHIRSFETMPDKNEKLTKDMQKLVKIDKFAESDFNEIKERVYKFINKFSKINEKEQDSIKNLCLVDAKTNSMLNNSIFDVKREIIKREEVKGRYIPICTRNVFLKTYTEYPTNNAYWTADDRECYYKSIENIYNEFINLK